MLELLMKVTHQAYILANSTAFINRMSGMNLVGHMKSAFDKKFGK